MEQGTSTVPNRVSFQRATAKAVFYDSLLTGGAGVDFGVIEANALDEGSSREKVIFPIDGTVTLGYDEIVSVAPIYTLKGRQKHSQIVPYLLMGTANTQVTQNSATGGTFTIASVALGKTYDIGKRNLTITFVKVGGVTKTPDVDYFIEANKGLIRFPNVAGGIAAGATVVVTFDQPAFTRDSITAFNRLNPQGSLQLFFMDNFSAIPLEEGLIPGILSRDKSNDGDPTKTDQWALRFAVTGQPTFLRRAA